MNGVFWESSRGRLLPYPAILYFERPGRKSSEISPSPKPEGDLADGGITDEVVKGVDYVWRVPPSKVGEGHPTSMFGDPICVRVIYKFPKLPKTKNLMVYPNVTRSLAQPLKKCKNV
jgi:hypothetical protein